MPLPKSECELCPSCVSPYHHAILRPSQIVIFPAYSSGWQAGSGQGRGGMVTSRPLADYFFKYHCYKIQEVSVWILKHLLKWNSQSVEGSGPLKESVLIHFPECLCPLVKKWRWGVAWGVDQEAL